MTITHTPLNVTPIFIFSLPRSGSTLLQRLIATHPVVATTSEPWLLLPLFLAYKDGYVFTSYQQRYLIKAFKDFLDNFSDKSETYHLAVRRFAHTFYDKACGHGQTHFLDKTPRYHLIAEDILNAFPNAKAILLWRNPLAIASSLLDTSPRRYWNLHKYRLDLYHGLSNLLNLQHNYGLRVFTLRYEDLVEHTNTYMSAIFKHIGITPVTDSIKRYKEIKLTGRMGDKKGDKIFSTVSTSSRDRWIRDLSTFSRREWARHYLRWLGRDRLSEMGYDLDTILTKLNTHPLGWQHIISDILLMCFGYYSRIVSKLIGVQ